MKLDYIFSGFFSFFIILLVGVLFGSFLMFFNISKENSVDIAVYLVWVLFVGIGYIFTKNGGEYKYINSLGLAVLVNVAFVAVVVLFKDFSLGFILEELIISIFSMWGGTLLFYLKQKIENKS